MKTILGYITQKPKQLVNLVVLQEWSLVTDDGRPTIQKHLSWTQKR